MTLPLLNVDIPLFGFYSVAPLLFILLHFYAMLQFYLLSKKVWHLDLAITTLCAARGVYRHPSAIEQLLPIFPFIHMLLGGQHRYIVRVLLTMVVLVTLVILPIWLLLFIQAAFLPYHDTFTTTVHRILITVDIVLTTGIWSFIVFGRKATRPEHKWRSLKQLLHNLLRFSFFNRKVAFWVVFLSALVILFGSLFILTFPGDPYPDERCEDSERCESHRGDPMDGWVPSLQSWVFAVVPGLQRNLILPERNFARTRPTKDQSDIFGPQTAWRFGQSANLGGRDLRYANFYRSILTHANFAHAFLYGVNLQDAELELAVFDDAHLEGASLKDANLRGATFFRANLDGADLEGAILEGAVLNRSFLRRASLIRADLEGAAFQCARLQLADLTYANLTGAGFWRANIKGASLAFADLGATDFRKAKGWQVDWPVRTQCVVELDDMSLAPPTQQDIAEMLETNYKLARIQGAAKREGAGGPKTASASPPLSNGLEVFDDCVWRRQLTPSDTVRTIETKINMAIPWEDRSRSLDEEVEKMLGDTACVEKNGKMPEPALVESIARRIVDEPVRMRQYRSKVAERLLDSNECPAAATLLEWYGRRLGAIVDHKKEPKAWAYDDDSCSGTKSEEESR